MARIENFAQYIEEVILKREEIESVVFKRPFSAWSELQDVPETMVGVVLTWEEAKPFLEQQPYDHSPERDNRHFDHYDVVIWSNRSIVYVETGEMYHNVKTLPLEPLARFDKPKRAARC